jgi:thioredoxin reductase (NADPH)
MQTIYDVAIIGAGPAGMTAGIFAARYKMKAIIFAKEIGGTCNTAHNVENYPGFKSISGIELMNNFKNHLDDYRVPIINEEVKGITKKEPSIFSLVSQSGEYAAKSIILASGTERKKLGIPGEREFLGKGVSYCATCDARFFTNKIVGVVGGSDTAVTSALLLSEYASKVFLIYRKDKLRSEPWWVEKAKNNPKIEIIYNTNVLKINGEKLINSVDLDNPYRGNKNLKLQGLFVEIGAYPLTYIVQTLNIKLSQSGEVVIDNECQTNEKGVFAAGDVTAFFGGLKQIITAAAGGAVAATSAYKWLTANSK